MRVASGQKIPDLNEIPEVEAALQQQATVPEEEGSVVSPGLSSPRDGEEDDVAKRAAAMLQGMRGGDGADDDDPEKRESLRRSRRQTAEEERRMRRRRREKASTVSSTSEGDSVAADPAKEEIPPTPTIEETPAET